MSRYEAAAELKEEKDVIEYYVEVSPSKIPEEDEAGAPVLEAVRPYLSDDSPARLEKELKSPKLKKVERTPEEEDKLIKIEDTKDDESKYQLGGTGAGGMQWDMIPMEDEQPPAKPEPVTKNDGKKEKAAPSRKLKEIITTKWLKKKTMGGVNSSTEDIQVVRQALKTYGWKKAENLLKGNTHRITELIFRLLVENKEMEAFSIAARQNVNMESVVEVESLKSFGSDKLVFVKNQIEECDSFGPLKSLIDSTPIEEYLNLKGDFNLNKQNVICIDDYNLEVIKTIIDLKANQIHDVSLSG